MEADWRVEAAADDPVVVVPWASPDAGPAFVDLRRAPETVDGISEARELPVLRDALLTLNRPDGWTWTAKCDAWEMVSEEIESIAMAFDFSSASRSGAAGGFASYIDVLLVDSVAFSSFRLHERWATMMTQSLCAGTVDHASGELAVEFVIRPALVCGAGRDAEGFAITAYVYGLGADAMQARALWASGLCVVAATLAAATPLAGNENRP